MSVVGMCAAGCGHTQDEHGAWGCCHLDGAVGCMCPRSMGVEVDHAEWMAISTGPRCRQRDAARAYRWILEEYGFGVPVDWPAVNLAVVKRWPRGLERVKRMAWSGVPL